MPKEKEKQGWGNSPDAATASRHSCYNVIGQLFLLFEWTVLQGTESAVLLEYCLVLGTLL